MRFFLASSGVTAKQPQFIYPLKLQRLPMGKEQPIFCLVYLRQTVSKSIFLINPNY